MDTHKISSLAADTFGGKPDHIEQLRGDASARRIYRIWWSGESYIAVCGDNIAENQAFVSFTRTFIECSLPVPEIVAVCPTNSTYILRDLGDVHLADLKESNSPAFGRRLKELYRSALIYLLQFQVEGASRIDFSKCYQHPQFGFENIVWDLRYYYYRFAKNVSESAPGYEYFEPEYYKLADMASQYADEFFLYRDFQSKNIMVVNNRLYFIDYQSGRRGALQYDLASILFDPYMNIPRNTRQELLTFYIENAEKTIDSVDRFVQGYYVFALIRLLQALGAYGFLTYVRGKTQYWAYVAPALHSCGEILGNELAKEFPRLSGQIDAISDLTNFETGGPKYATSA